MILVGFSCTSLLSKAVICSKYVMNYVKYSMKDIALSLLTSLDSNCLQITWP